jgi:hypothetical protein
MALSNAISEDVIVQVQDRGPVDGSAAALSIVTVTTLARRLQVSKRVGKRIDVSGFGSTNNFRPGKRMWEITLEILIAYAGRIATVEGNYFQVEYTIGSNSEEQFIGFVESDEDDINDDAEAIQRLVIVGPVDGGALV